MTTIDFQRAIRDAKSASFEALPIGDYDVEVAEATALRSSNGKPMIKAQLKVLDGPYQNRRIFNNFVFSMDNAMALSIFFRQMKSFGLDDKFFAALGANGSLEPVAQALIQRRARVTLGIRQWQGEDRNEVTQIKPYTGAPGIPALPMPTPAPMPAPAPQPQAVTSAQVVPLQQQPAPAVVLPPAQPAQQLQAAQSSGLDEFRPVAVPTPAGPSVATSESSTSPQTQPTSESAPPAQQPVAPTPPELPF